MELLLETGVAATLAPEIAWLFGGPEQAKPGGPADLIPEWLSADQETLDAARARAWRILDLLDAFMAAETRDIPREAVYQGQPSNALLVALLVAPFVPDLLGGREKEGERMADVTERIEAMLRPLVTRLRISRRDSERARQVLLALRRLVPGRRRRARPMAMVRRDYFTEALATYELLLQAEGQDREDVARWKAMWRSSFRHPEAKDQDEDTGRASDGQPARDRLPAEDTDAPRNIWSADGEPEGAAEEDRGEDEGGATDLESDEPMAEGAESASGPAGAKKRRRRRGGRRRRRGGETAALSGTGGDAAVAAAVGSVEPAAPQHAHADAAPRDDAE